MPAHVLALEHYCTCLFSSLPCAFSMHDLFCKSVPAAKSVCVIFLFALNKTSVLPTLRREHQQEALFSMVHQTRHLGNLCKLGPPIKQAMRYLVSVGLLQLCGKANLMMQLWRLPGLRRLCKLVLRPQVYKFWGQRVPSTLPTKAEHTGLLVTSLPATLLKRPRISNPRGKGRVQEAGTI